MSSYQIIGGCFCSELCGRRKGWRVPSPLSLSSPCLHYTLTCSLLSPPFRHYKFTPPAPPPTLLSCPFHHTPQTSVFSPSSSSSSSCLINYFLLYCLLTMSSTPWEELQHPSRPTSHAPCRRSLSARSLWMCTETLGCETGIIDYHSTSSEEDDEYQHLRDGSLSPVRTTAGFLAHSRAKAEISRRSYPPPLTSMDRIKVKASREDGRLLIRTVPSYMSMHVERSDGRLLIRLVNTALAALSSPFESQQDQYVEEDVHAEGSNIEDDEEEGEKMEEEDEEHEEETMSLQFGSGDCQHACGSCEMNGEREMGDVTDPKFQRPTRCKEGGHENKGLLSWGTFCVASS